ncbi:MAG TPA: MOSC N-terminal beta barrel domain-containing protein, partial [Gemmatimonadales bacterium]|nr:MOSC N-terminal beta barrel domain-containing protein [Gemmatimonadales bacterium]
MRLAALNVYPLKGAAGIALETWPLSPLGLEYDRRWMLVTPEGMFLTQRDFPKLCLIRTAISPPYLILTAPGTPSLQTPLAPSQGTSLEVEVWRDRCQALLPDPDADRWCTAVLGTPCRLVYMPEASARVVDPRYDQLDRRVGFADAFPFLLIGTASLEALNRRLAQPLPMNRFRPNLVVDGASPFGEDRWRRIRIGAVEFDV